MTDVRCVPVAQGLATCDDCNNVLPCYGWELPGINVGHSQFPEWWKTVCDVCLAAYEPLNYLQDLDEDLG